MPFKNYITFYFNFDLVSRVRRVNKVGKWTR